MSEPEEQKFGLPGIEQSQGYEPMTLASPSAAQGLLPSAQTRFGLVKPSDVLYNSAQNMRRQMFYAGSHKTGGTRRTPASV